MSVFKVASRYAKSLIDLSNEHHNLDVVKADMEGVVDVLKSNTELQAVLNNPIIKTDRKQAILNALFKDKVNEEILSFFAIMIRKGRSEIVYPTAIEFISQYNELKGIVHAEVVSAIPLTEANLEALNQQISQEINAQVILKNKVDKSLIGGFIVKVGDRQLDVSIQGKLNKLERHFQNQGI